MTRVGERLAAAMPEVGIRRLVVISAAGVRESEAQLTAPVRWLIHQGNVAVAYRDLAGMERRLEASSLDWLAVRPVTLTGGAATHRAAPVQRYRFASTIRRADVAEWMLDASTRPEPYSVHTVMLGTAPRTPA
jgi:hypothetical protein